MDFLPFFRRRPDLPKFAGRVSTKEFMAATGLTQRHLDRFGGEGLLRTSYLSGSGEVVDNAADFVERTMRPSIAGWPPPLPVLDGLLQEEYARSGANPSVATRILEPFRFHALGARWDDVVNLARPSARLVPGGDALIGGSRLGGIPDVPAGFAWPHFFDDDPLAFVAQVDLAEIQDAYPTALVPTSGLLSFYYDAKQEVWGFDPKDRGRWTVLYFSGPLAQASYLPANLSSEGRYRPVPLRPRGELTLPEPDSLEVERLGLSPSERDAYGALSGELEGLRGQTIHRFLGWPEQIQHDPAAEVQLPANGIYAGDAGGYRSEDGLRLMAERDVWQLLLQVDSEDAAAMMWGDAGRLYYMIRKDDLARGDWESTWFCLQCY